MGRQREAGRPGLSRVSSGETGSPADVQCWSWRGLALKRARTQSSAWRGRRVGGLLADIALLGHLLHGCWPELGNFPIALNVPHIWVSLCRICPTISGSFLLSLHIIFPLAQGPSRARASKQHQARRPQLGSCHPQWCSCLTVNAWARQTVFTRQTRLHARCVLWFFWRQMYASCG